MQSMERRNFMWSVWKLWICSHIMFIKSHHHVYVPSMQLLSTFVSDYCENWCDLKFSTWSEFFINYLEFNKTLLSLLWHPEIHKKRIKNKQKPPTKRRINEMSELIRLFVYFSSLVCRNSVCVKMSVKEIYLSFLTCPVAANISILTSFAFIFFLRFLRRRKQYWEERRAGSGKRKEENLINDSPKLDACKGLKFLIFKRTLDVIKML